MIFPSRKSQADFLLEIKKSRKMRWKDLAAEWKVNVRTVASWARGEHHMPHELAISVSKDFGIRLPDGTRLLKWSEHVAAAGARGALMNLQKNGSMGGDAGHRKEKWREWWNSVGKHKNIAILKANEINLPPQSEELAEFVGIMLGDGGVAAYHLNISLNKNEMPYVRFIQSLIKKLFGVSSSLSFRKDCAGLDIIVNRKKLVDFLNSSGLPIGSKIRQGADIPEWIMKSIPFQKACIRGLIDTDGCFFIHSYISNAKTYRYLKIDFTSVSKPLLQSARKILINLGFNVRISRDGKAIRVESQRDVLRYLSLIGTHNSRYDEKLEEFGVNTGKIRKINK